MLYCPQHKGRNYIQAEGTRLSEQRKGNQRKCENFD